MGPNYVTDIFIYIELSTLIHLILVSSDAQVPLPEDVDLQGFIPIEKAFINLK